MTNKYSQYLSENNAEKELTTVGDNTALWYTDYNNKLQKIVHGKNLCTKHETGHQDATCTEKGWKEYGCTLERDNHAAAPTHTDSWKEYIPALGHDWKDNGEANHICDRDHVTAAHSYGEWTTAYPGHLHHRSQKQHTCTVCGHVETQEILPPATTGRTTAMAPTPAPTAVPPEASPSTPTAPLSCGWWTLEA